MRERERWCEELVVRKRWERDKERGTATDKLENEREKKTERETI